MVTPRTSSYSWNPSAHRQINGKMGGGSSGPVELPRTPGWGAVFAPDLTPILLQHPWRAGRSGSQLGFR